MAKPKSVMATLPSSFLNKFSNFRSLCTMPILCKYSTATRASSLSRLLHHRPALTLKNLAHEGAHLGLGKVAFGLNMVKDFPTTGVLHDHGHAIGQSKDPHQFDNVGVCQSLQTGDMRESKPIQAGSLQQEC